MGTKDFFQAAALLVFASAGYVFYQYHYQPAQMLEDALTRAQAGDAQAQLLAGDIYLSCSLPFLSDSLVVIDHGWDNSRILFAGLTTHCNPDKGRKWYLAAAEAGNAQGQFGYGLLLAQEDNFLGNAHAAEALQWLEKAIAQGHLHATYWAGIMHQKLHEEDKAIALFKMAANRGDSDAQWKLSAIFDRGEQRDAEEAYFWALLSIRNPAKPRPDIDDLPGSFTPEQKAAAIKRANQWKPETK